MAAVMEPVVTLMLKSLQVSFMFKISWLILSFLFSSRVIVS